MKITIECEPKEIADLVTGITKPTIRLSDSNREALQKQFNAYQERFDKEVSSCGIVSEDLKPITAVMLDIIQWL